MTDRPILFSAPMIRALLDGRKTQTRRVLALPEKTASGGSHYVRPDMGGWEPAVHGGGGCFTFGKNGQRVPVPEMVGLYHGTCGTSIVTPIQRGDRLWVREAWCPSFDEDNRTIRPPTGNLYRADGGHVVLDDGNGCAVLNRDGSEKSPWRPSIHMPRRASRLTLYVTDVRVQRLQDISEADAQAEGVECDSDGWRDYLMPQTQCCSTATDGFRTLWASINGPGAWEANPWVAAYTCEARRGNIDRLPLRIGELAA